MVSLHTSLTAEELGQHSQENFSTQHFSRIQNETSFCNTEELMEFGQERIDNN